MYRLSCWQALRDYRCCCLVLACVVLLGMLIKPSTEQNVLHYNFIFVVDITRSMNAVDYQQEEQASSRLEFVKQQLRQLLHRLPCSTQVGLGVFTERRATLLFEPISICDNYAELDTVISNPVGRRRAGRASRALPRSPRPWPCSGPCRAEPR